eukprot:TRINITY_DN18792_c0_g1_i1.p1 TRINITY_DN18792_c0_g1~~TRINITY_DN18792_c0_g1_i1.p1  ORF type:complete len:355 (+),score=79.88 TRINITY_DN18792_c0_g1_i1:162-1226(+)
MVGWPSVFGHFDTKKAEDTCEQAGVDAATCGLPCGRQLEAVFRDSETITTITADHHSERSSRVASRALSEDFLRAQSQGHVEVSTVIRKELVVKIVSGDIDCPGRLTPPGALKASTTQIGGSSSSRAAPAYPRPAPPQQTLDGPSGGGVEDLGARTPDREASANCTWLGSSTFGFRLYRTHNEPLGLDLRAVPRPTSDEADPCVLICELAPGPAYDWSAAQQQAGGRGLREGDRIIQVNGVAGDCKRMLKCMAEDPSVDLVVRRRVQIVVQVTKGSGGPIGLDVVMKTGRQGLHISKVCDGPIRRWNEAKSSEEQVRERDRIVEVNGMSALSSRELLERMRVADDLNMLVVSFN